jgi:hypothetical protein
MVKNSSILAQRYFDGCSWLRYLPLFKLMNDTPSPQGRMLELL